MSKEYYKTIIRPVITEKSTWLKEKNRDMCFEVAPQANKQEIKEAVESLLKVKVDKVRVVKKKGKRRRMGRSQGWTKDWKKAYVRLKEGEKMVEYFEAV